MALHVKKNDTVVVLSGKDRGKRGKVIGTVPKEGKVVVEGINLATCHVKARRQDEQGGIITREAALAACKVQVVCPKCDRPTRVGHQIHEGSGSVASRKVRVCKHCGAEL